MAVNMDAILRIATRVVGTEQVTALRGSFQQVESAASSLTSRLGPLIGLAGGIGLLGKIFGDTATLQTQTKSLEVLLGSAERAKGIVKELQSYGAVTPFESTELIETAKRLNAFGIEGGKVVSVTKRLGDIAGATGSNLGELATAYGQVVAKGRLQTEELLQFQERGVGIQGELQKMYNMSGEELQKALSKGEISAAFFEQAIINLTATGGKYANGATAQSTTLAGRLSTLKDSFTSLSQTIGETMLPAFELTLNVLTKIVGAIDKLPEPLKAAAGVVALLGVGLLALAPLLNATVSIVTTLAGLGLGATLAGWAGALVPFAQGFAALVAGFVTAPVLIGAALIAAGAAIFIFRDSIGKTFQEIWATIADPKTGFIAIIGMAWNNMVDGMKAYLAGIVKPIADTWNAIVNSVRGAINGAIRLAGQGINALIEQANRLLFAYNAVANVTHLPQVGLIQYVQVPQFADGGRVDRPTLLMAGEGGQPEYIVPQSKVPQFIGAHMGDAGLGLQGGAKGGQAPVVNISTGPVMQQPDGSRWVSVEDAQGMVSDAADQIWRGLTSYDGRRALGLVR